MRMIRALGLLALMTLAGCATVSGPASPQNKASTHAAALAQQGQFDQAAQAYMQLAAQHPQSRDYYRLRAAETWREEGNLNQVTQVLAQINRSNLSPHDQHIVDLLQAQISLNKGDYARALALTSGSVDALSPNIQQRTLELRAQAQAASGMYYPAAMTRQQMDDQLQGMDKAQNEREIVQLLGQLGVNDLKQRRSTLAADSPMQTWIQRALGQLGVAVALDMPPANQPVGTLMPGQAQGQGWQNPGSVALLLPMTGSLGNATRLIREGFFASYFNDHAGEGQRPPVKVYDSGGTPQQAIAAYQQAVAAGAKLVIGPLTREDVRAVITQASLPVPVLALNHPDINTVPPPNVNEFGLMPETEGAEAAQRMLAQGLTRADVVVSSEDFAQRASQAFIRHFTAGGGQIIGNLTLDPSVINYAAQISTIAPAPPPKNIDTDKKAAAKYVKGLAAQQAGSGIFISMRPPQARMVLPQLRLAQLKQPVFATSHVYDGYDNPDSDRDLDGVTFCDIPWLFDTQPGLPSRNAIANLLPRTSGSGARLFAFGMDAWTLAPYLDWLRTHPGSYVPGATGQLVEDDFGRIQRNLTWATFKNGLARPVSGSLDLSAPIDQPMQPTQPAAAASSAGAGTPAAVQGH
ncbi:penicillin-binding protein activator [Oleiagrimonas sp.]|jgi:outer membrane PBP1 activator LpoA protein|uniref:penicillin-binding protein activator n=1 Tax=Oleiagrimonas sp. TaxID=2010330 RepID=UPI00260FD0F0|nr:penicillin-binding protein activator [Oleiagrimonas sp.]MDA3914900.1 penicillin-binding protein activator [Oleiagrimonas sp.]